MPEKTQSNDTAAEILVRLAGALQNHPTKAEFLKSFEGVMEKVKEIETKNGSDFQAMQQVLSDFAQQVRDDTTGDLETFKAEALALIDAELTKAASTVDEKVRQVDDAIAGIRHGKDADEVVIVEKVREQIGPMPIPLDALDIRNFLEALSGDERLKPSAIDGLDEMIAEVRTGLAAPRPGGGRVGWGAHPLTVQALGLTVAKNVRFINFKGTGFSSAILQPDGVLDITLTSGGGAGGTVVLEETPTNTGDDIHFTLAHIPIAGTLRVFRGGARQQSIGVTPDYTQVGTALTLSIALNADAGEQLLVEYEY